jgi:hypothetical protein
MFFFSLSNKLDVVVAVLFAGGHEEVGKNFQQHPLLREFIINNLFLNYSLQTAETAAAAAPEYCKQMNYHLKINAARIKRR